MVIPVYLHPLRYSVAPDFNETMPKCPASRARNWRPSTTRYQLCLELKSLKLYVWSFRDEGVYHEAVTNRTLNDLVVALP